MRQHTHVGVTTGAARVHNVWAGRRNHWGQFWLTRRAARSRNGPRGAAGEGTGTCFEYTEYEWPQGWVLTHTRTSQLVLNP